MAQKCRNCGGTDTFTLGTGSGCYDCAHIHTAPDGSAVPNGADIDRKRDEDAARPTPAA